MSLLGTNLVYTQIEQSKVESKAIAKNAMNILFRHIKAFALLLSFALIFVNTVGAVGMVSMQHGALGSDSSHGMHAQMAAMPDHANDSTHMHGHGHTQNTETSSDGMDDSSCAASCAAHCTTTVFYKVLPLTTPMLVTKTARIPSPAPHAAMVSGLYKPPKLLH